MVKPRFDRHATLSETDSQELRVYWSEWRANHWLNIRWWFKSQDGKWRPSKKGVAIAAANAPLLLEAIKQVSEAGA